MAKMLVNMECQMLNGLFKSMFDEGTHREADGNRCQPSPAPRAVREDEIELMTLPIYVGLASAFFYV
jgi:hypothetical protein